jgi:hypothetical protein
MLLFRVLTYKPHVITQLNKYYFLKFAQQSFSDDCPMNFIYDQSIKQVSK